MAIPTYRVYRLDDIIAYRLTSCGDMCIMRTSLWHRNRSVSRGACILGYISTSNDFIIASYRLWFLLIIILLVIGLLVMELRVSSEPVSSIELEVSLEVLAPSDTSKFQMIL